MLHETIQTYNIKFENKPLLNERITGTLDDAKRQALQTMRYVRSTVTICNERKTIAVSSRWNPSPCRNNDDVLMSFGIKGFYEKW